MALEEAEATHQADSCSQCGPTSRVDCLLRGRGFGQKTAVPAATPTAQASGPEVHTPLCLDRVLCIGARPFHRLRRRRSWSPTSCSHAHCSSYSSSLLPFDHPENWSANIDSLSSWTCLCAVDRSYGRYASIGAVSVVRNLWTDFVADDCGAGRCCDVASSVSRR